jgi:uncharacterized protein (DUF2147 family)
MKTFFRKLAPALIALALAGPAIAGARNVSNLAAVDASEWRNPKDTVHIRAHRCGDGLCGTISWASEKAMADARKKGVTQLVGTRIFRDFRPTGEARWKGKVYVPDIGQTFSGTLAFTDPNTMVGKGCVLFGAVCKSQTWSRVR